MGTNRWEARRTVIAWAVAILMGPIPAHANLGTAIEFYNPTLRHYFITAYPEEAAALDAGTNVKGWQRTGGEFTVFTDPAPGLQAVCRFFGTPGKGINSHFYTGDPDECAKVMTLPAWTFEAIAFYIPIPVKGQCGGSNPVYRSFYSDNVADANHRFTVDLTAYVRMTKRGDALEGVVMCAPVTDSELDADVVRFLEQATLGPTEALVQEVKAKGIAAWIDAQLAMNTTRYTQYPHFDRPADALLCVDDDTPPVTPEKYCHTNKISPLPPGWEFFRQAKAGPDQLRMRMAHVWHQIFVTSDSNGTYTYADFQQRMREGAFGSYEALLQKYALAPMLGEYQSWIHNVPEHEGIKPNENFARELMQLFTIGTSVLNSDGTPKLDVNGSTIPSYDQADIATMARVLTGFGFPPIPGLPPTWGSKRYYLGDMVAFEEFHDKGAKTALGGRLVLPQGGGALAEVRAALHALAEHPNTPPFIAKQLIQKTVTSAPTPGYVARIAAVFRDNGLGVRGDLAAVTRAILLDPEARGSRKIDPEYGRMREPALLLTAMIRGLDIATDGFSPQEFAAQSGQVLFFPQSVFNYYPADFTLAGGAIPAPEFGIFGTAEFLNRLNQIVTLLYNADLPFAQAGRLGPQPYVPNAIGTHIPTLTEFLPYAGNVEAIVDRVNRLFMHGAMPPTMRHSIVNAVRQLPTENPAAQARLALRLTLTSIDYQVQK